tara:strand:- start:1467 stop:1859 length:393 start_codon:yes stop_codon:yes gene_type:complete
MDKKERKRIANKKYIQSEKGKECRKNYYLNNKQKYIDNAKQWKSNNTDKSTKSNTISCWKNRGIITDDFDNVYSIYIDTTNCDYCKKEFKNSLDRHLDHDHSIKDNNNIRGILCCPCNLKDVLKGCPPIF